jgi:hypothetical protein
MNDRITNIPAILGFVIAVRLDACSVRRRVIADHLPRHSGVDIAYAAIHPALDDCLDFV